MQFWAVLIRASCYVIHIQDTFIISYRPARVWVNSIVIVEKQNVYVWIPRTLIRQLSENIFHFRQQMRLWQTLHEPNTFPYWMLHGKLSWMNLVQSF